jgi:microcystin-dependent protein
MVVPIGGTIMWNSKFLPYGETDYFAFEDGSAVSRSTYDELFDVLVPLIGNFTVTIATPAVFTLNSHGLEVGDKVYLTTSGALPTGLSANTIYYVTNPATNTFNLSTSLANAIASTKINTTGSQSGTHTLRYCPNGLGNGSTTFNLPNMTGRMPIGVDNTSTEFKALGVTGGSKTHTMTVGEIATHTHTQNSHNHTQNQHNHETYRTTPKGGTGGAAGGDNIDGYGGGQGTANTTATNIATTATNQDTGSSTPFDILNPYATKYFIIRLK